MGVGRERGGSLIELFSNFLSINAGFDGSGRAAGVKGLKDYRGGLRLNDELK